VAALRTAVAGLAREVEALRRGMRHVPSTGDLARLADTVAELSETVAAMQTAGGGGRGSEAIPSWLTLPRDLPSARAVLSDLTGWLRDVYLRYADAAREFPECWLWHPEIVEELVWLMYAWLAAYRDDEASVRAAGEWHDRLRPGVVRRVHGYARTCSLENHLPGRPNATGAPYLPVVDSDADRDATAVVAAWWTDQRDEPGPAPTSDQMTAAATPLFGHTAPAMSSGSRAGLSSTSCHATSTSIKNSANRGALIVRRHSDFCQREIATSGCYIIVRDISCHDGASTYDNVVANGDLIQHDCVSANPHVVANRDSFARGALQNERSFAEAESMIASHNHSAVTHHQVIANSHTTIAVNSRPLCAGHPTTHVDVAAVGIDVAILFYI
jgi:hypothetical protein